MNRKLPIGIQDFATLRKDHYLYVDKTGYIYQLVHEGKPYFLSRPRRFGKSLLLSTLRAYWEGRSDLFQGLEIEKLEADSENAWQPYPVFLFDFNRSGYTKERLEDLLTTFLMEWEAVWHFEENASCSVLSIRFQNLLKKAFDQTGKRSVVLVDEYDKPFLDALEMPDQAEHNKEVFRSFFGSLKSSDEFLEFVFITGVTKFSKISIFSDLNQLNDISLSEEYAGLCGITEEELCRTFWPEISEMAETQEIDAGQCLRLLRQYYDGYCFHPSGPGVYNPFSVLKALYEREFGSYWFETGTPGFLVRKLKDLHFDVQRFENSTLYIGKKALSDYQADNPDPVPLLYQTGYLTISDYNKRLDRYTLDFPNEEVKYGFLESLMPVYVRDYGSATGKDIYSLDSYVESGKTDEVKNVFISLFASIPYTTHDAPFEHYFQTVIFIVFTLLGKYVQCEIHTFQGRIDCVVETDRYVWIFEFKRDESAREALRQIKDCGYAVPYVADKRTVICVVAGFDSKSRMLTDWQIEMPERK